jgi:sterol desaturase/sphingolipid hydroxylase (fatty acid hydroxylase superfamily)
MLNQNMNSRSRGFSQLQCFMIFLLLLCPVVYVIIQLENSNRFSFHLLLYFAGWLTYTFLEYIAHRFWMHAKEKKQPGQSLERHMHHHRHPAELRITAAMRSWMLTGTLLLIVTSSILNNYFTAFAGFYAGFVYYCFIHYFLHKPWAGKVMPRLQASHIHHHCKYPDRCFGTCVTWWDILFKTGVPMNIRIPERVVEFYFGNHDTVAKDSLNGARNMVQPPPNDR